MGVSPLSPINRPSRPTICLSSSRPRGCPRPARFSPASAGPMIPPSAGRLQTFPALHTPRAQVRFAHTRHPPPIGAIPGRWVAGALAERAEGERGSRADGGPGAVRRSWRFRRRERHDQGPHSRPRRGQLSIPVTAAPDLVERAADHLASKRTSPDPAPRVGRAHRPSGPGFPVREAARRIGISRPGERAPSAWWRSPASPRTLNEGNRSSRTRDQEQQGSRPSPTRLIITADYTPRVVMAFLGACGIFSQPCRKTETPVRHRLPSPLRAPS